MSEKEKMNVNTAPAVDTSTGTAEDVEAIMKKYDRESNTRIWEGVPKKVVRYLLAAFALLMVYMNLFANWDERVRRSLFVGIVIILSFLVYPAKKGSTKKNHIPIYDIVLMVLGAGAYFYFVINFKTIIGHATRISQLEVIVGIIGILVLAETCRRVVGIPILCVATVFIGYAFYSGLGAGRAFPQVLKSIVYNLFYTTSGVIGTPIGVCSTYIALFILFGAFLEATGISEFFIQLANSLAGASTGGPAKVAVIGSALFGTISGNSAANVVASGTFTIPMMIKVGYSPRFASAVEAVASTGGQMTPPILGAAAFIIAELTGTPYLDVALATVIPAILYFVSIFYMIDLEAYKEGLHGYAKDELPDARKVLLERGHLVIPIFVLIFVLIGLNASVIKAAIWAIYSTILCTFLRKSTRLTPEQFVAGFADGAKQAVGLIAACATAGIIIGVLNLTGTGLKFASGIIALSGGILPIALILTMGSSLILGMGLPTAAAYLICAAVIVPALTGLGVPALTGHLFIFYFACLSAITPPVALAAFTAASLGKTKPMGVALTAVRLGIVAFIVPFMFVYAPSLLWQGSLPEILGTLATSLCGVFFLGSALQGAFRDRVLNMGQRGLFLLGSLALIQPGLVTDLIGVGLVACALLWQWLGSRRG